MSEIDKAFAEREARRLEQERERRERVDVAAAFLTEFFDKDIAASRTLAERGITAHLDGHHLLLYQAQAGIHADPFIIAVGEQGEIDVAGRSLGRYSPDVKVGMRRELVEEILNAFDL
ncbi:MAG: hypothetical protein AB7O43_18110 [Hyphomicrobiaceae bacterium]